MVVVQLSIFEEIDNFLAYIGEQVHEEDIENDEEYVIIYGENNIHQQLHPLLYLIRSYTNNLQSIVNLGDDLYCDENNPNCIYVMHVQLDITVKIDNICKIYEILQNSDRCIYDIEDTYSNNLVTDQLSQSVNNDESMLVTFFFYWKYV